jgi:TetR/AcrR family transcriptional regulator, regulator of cefoperazone and chloramphenicol sensitivity
VNSRRSQPSSAPAPADASAGAPPAEEPRHRLLHSGLRLFAAQGYSKTSTRELAEAAGVNVAAISYYFGDKAGLYRAAFCEPMGAPEDDLARYNGDKMSLPEALRGFYAGFLEPLKQGDVSRLCMKLHFREMLEPTGLWDADPSFGIRDMHEALVAVLCRHLGLNPADAAADLDLQRLAICIAGLGVHLHVGHDINNVLAPGINEGDANLDRWSERLVEFALALVQSEKRRRSGAGSAASNRSQGEAR